MSSSNHHQFQIYNPAAPLGSSTTQKIKSSWSIEDFLKKVTITNETIHKNKVVNDYNGRVGIKQEVVNRRTETVKDRRRGTVEEFIYEVTTKNGVVYGKEEKGKIWLGIKDKTHGSHYWHHQSREVVKYESQGKCYRYGIILLAIFSIYLFWIAFS